jgi:hypothetical protein
MLQEIRRIETVSSRAVVDRGVVVRRHRRREGTRDPRGVHPWLARNSFADPSGKCPFYGLFRRVTLSRDGRRLVSDRHSWVLAGANVPALVVCNAHQSVRTCGPVRPQKRMQRVTALTKQGARTHVSRQIGIQTPDTWCVVGSSLMERKMSSIVLASVAWACDIAKFVVLYFLLLGAGVVIVAVGHMTFSTVKPVDHSASRVAWSDHPSIR